MNSEDSAVYKTLLESTRAIPWKIDWNTLKFAYIGPQIEHLLGWSPASWVSAEDWASRMHPDDRSWVVDFCIAQSKAGTDHEADYRAVTKDGNYVWIRDVVHVMRNADGEVEALIGFMFDISERKATEEKLIAMQKELEILSFKDGLTGLFNRRMFDSIMETEWANAARNQQPLSLIMLDIDYFKQYNDHYGHIQGDECLKQVSQVLGAVATRPRDFLARFGGEEFILVLPETNLEAATQIAERCKKLLLLKHIPHEASKTGKLITISQGVGTIIPGREDSAIKFIELVDQRLYQAKQNGRDQIVSE